MGKLTYNTKLVFKDSKDKVALIDILTKHLISWNNCSYIKYTIPDNSIVILHSNFYKQFRLAYPDTPAQVVIRAECDCLSAYRSVKSNKHSVTKPLQRKSLSMRLDKRCYSCKNGVFSIISAGKRVKCMPYLYPKLKELLGKYKLCDPLIFERGGDIWIAMTFDVPETLPTRTLALGIDLGCRVVAATSEGNLYLDKVFNAQRRRLRYLKRCLQAKAMKRSRTAAKHLKKLKRKETNKNKNFVHHLTNKILKDTKADTLILENLKSIKVKRNKYQNKNRISQVPFYMIKQFLTYKAHLLNRQVETVSPAWTSQTDAVTGKRDGTRKGRRYYSKSGMIYDADINASCVIAHRSKLPVSQKLLTYGQATVNTPIVSNRGDKLPTFSR